MKTKKIFKVVSILSVLVLILNTFTLTTVAFEDPFGERSGTGSGVEAVLDSQPNQNVLPQDDNSAALFDSLFTNDRSGTGTFTDYVSPIDTQSQDNDSAAEFDSLFTNDRSGTGTFTDYVSPIDTLPDNNGNTDTVNNYYDYDYEYNYYNNYYDYDINYNYNNNQNYDYDINYNYNNNQNYDYDYNYNNYNRDYSYDYTTSTRRASYYDYPRYNYHVYYQSVDPVYYYDYYGYSFYDDSYYLRNAAYACDAYIKNIKEYGNKVQFTIQNPITKKTIAVFTVEL